MDGWRLNLRKQGIFFQHLKEHSSLLQLVILCSHIFHILLTFILDFIPHYDHDLNQNCLFDTVRTYHGRLLSPLGGVTAQWL